MPRVLVVDDDPMVCGTIEVCLTRKGFEVTVANGGEAGMRALESADFDVMQALQEDTDVDWRPRVPQWPAIGDTMATAIQSALSGQATVKAALDDAQKRIEPMMRG